MTTSKTRGAKVTVKCEYCGCTFEARVADRKRGWARFCSKRCKAIKQTKSKGVPNFLYQETDRVGDLCYSAPDHGQF